MIPLASQISFRNAVVAALAMLAVVLISTSVPGDRASAQAADPFAEYSVRAAAWWGLLTDNEKVFAIEGVEGAATLTPEEREEIVTAPLSFYAYELVDGDTTIDDDVDLYAVGGHFTDSSGNTIQPLRGFQSVDLWWDRMDCVSRNVATGTDNVASADGVGFCNVYSDLDEASRARADEVGVAILGIDEPGAATTEDIENAANWWNMLTPDQRTAVIVGPGKNVATTQPEYSSLIDLIKELVNDRWMYIYGIGGNDPLKWWDAANCTQRLIATGVNNWAVVDAPQCNFGTSWENFNRVPANNLDQTVAAPIRTRGITSLSLIDAILGIDSDPNPANWWDALSNTEKLNVIYGDPQALHDPAGDLTEADRAKVEVPYSELANSGSLLWGNAGQSSRLSPGLDVLLVRQGATSDVCSDPTTDPCTMDSLNMKTVVDAIARDIWDPPSTLASLLGRGGAAQVDDFDPPYASIADWWQEKDCRSKRLAVGEDNDVLASDESSAGGYCKFYPGDPTATGSSQWLSATAYARVREIAMALGIRPAGSPIVRPSFNMHATTGDIWIQGTAVVGSTLMLGDISSITDPDGIPSDAVYTYQWLRDGMPITGATGTSYVVTEADIGAVISARISFTDAEYFPEMVTTMETSQVTFGGVSEGLISRIEPGIRSVTVSAGDQVVLQVNIYGLQGIHDQSLGNGVIFTWMQDGNTIDGMNSSLTYTAPSAPGAYMIVASVGDEDCLPADDADMETACSAEFEVRVRRPAAPQPAAEPPVNPPGEIPTILTDSQGAQYEVFTPVEGGTFDAGEGYSIMAPSGAVPNGEYIGVRMSDDGMVSNAGVTSHRYTLGGNMYGIHAVDSTGASVTDYVLEDPARVCVPLPDVLRGQISDLALVTINSDNTLTILAANVRLGTSGTSVCGNLSNLPASVAVGSFGSPDAIPTATPEPTPIPPETGASSPSSNSAVWALLLGIAVLALGSFIILGRRRGNIRA